MLRRVLATVFLCTALPLCHAAMTAADLGRLLFFDANLSLQRTQSCARCHDESRAFSDGRDNGVRGAASLGDDGRSLGDRNAPALTYVALTPPFRIRGEGQPAGGFFLDGRVATLQEQAAEPFVNPLEMQMPDPTAVVARVRENPTYERSLRRLFGEAVFEDTDTAYRAVGESLAAFEQADELASFDSRYDRHLRGEYQMSEQEALGRDLFFSQLTNCSLCHALSPHATNDARETFTDYGFRNIGVPANAHLRSANGTKPGHTDRGLLENPAVERAEHAGKFKVPTLRNVAVTAPYMHNGVFRELRTAIHFYNRYLVRNPASMTNPETGEPWAPAEVEETVDLALLREGQPLSDERIALIEAFLRTLTDERYEHLLEK
jgi:cytochrome c peroxidase